jgi:hypothetical protein
MPEEHVEYHKRQAAKQESQVREFTTFFQECSIEQLLVLSKLVNLFTNPDNGWRIAVHYEGWIDAALQYHHKVCFICGEDHSEALLRGEDPHPGGKSAAMEKSQPQVEGDPTQEIDRDFEYPPGVEPHLTKDQTEIIRIYGLDTQYKSLEDGTFEYDGVVCTKCGLRYMSPEDRALKGVNDCQGCHNKSAWG